MGKKKGKKPIPAAPEPIDQSPGILLRIWMHLENIAGSRPLFWICAAILPLAVLAYYPSYEAFRSDNDLWFHLAYGKHYVENLTWRIDHSMFSWTPAFNPSSYVTWIGSFILYLVHQAWGITGLFVLRLAIFIASAGMALWLAKSANIRIGVGLLAGLLLTAVTMHISGQFIKPTMFSIFLLALTVACYLKFRMSPGAWIIAAFPLLFLFWVNTHGLWQFGIVFLGLVFAVDLFLYMVYRGQALDRKSLVYLAWAAGFTFLALCVNPYGPSIPIGFIRGRILQVLSVFFSTAGSSSGGGSTLDYYYAVAEYQSLWQHLFYGEKELFFTVTALGAAVMILLFLSAWFVSWKRSGKADLPVAAANIVFFFLAMAISRLVMVFALIWILSLVFLAWRAGPGPFVKHAGFPALAAFLLLTAYSAFASVCLYPDSAWFGRGYQDYVPDKEVRYIKKNELPGPMFNDYISGSYLMWALYPKYKVFIDSRQFPYRDQVFPDYTSIGITFPLDALGVAAFTQKYPFQFALIKYHYSDLITWFYKSPDWTLIYFNTAAAVMVRRDMLPALSREAKGAMHPPSYYRDIHHPNVLADLFSMYQIFLGNRYAAQMREIFDQNVSDLYWHKKRMLLEMDKAMGKRF